jgi:hypothetical protein
MINTRRNFLKYSSVFFTGVLSKFIFDEAVEYNKNSSSLAKFQPNLTVHLFSPDYLERHPDSLTEEQLKHLYPYASEETHGPMGFLEIGLPFPGYPLRIDAYNKNELLQ